jgi:hypothetical protein
MEKNFEIARIDFSISKLYHAINFYNGRGESGLGYFSTLEEAKECIQLHKSERPSEKWPYVVIHYEGENGRIVYIEYADTRLIKVKI